jgi:cytochrome P450
MMILQLTPYAILLLLIALLLGVFIFFITKQKWLTLHLPPSPRALPIIGHLHLLGPLIHQSFHELSSRYGTLLYLKLGSVPCILASTPELAKQLLKANDLAFSSRKNSLAADHLTYNSPFAFAPYGPYWKFMNKLVTTELLGNRTLNQFLSIRTKELHEFIRYLANKAEAGERVNVTDGLLKLTSNIISQMMLSIRCSGTDSQAEEARTLVREVTNILGEFNVSDFIWFCRNLDLQGFRKRFEDVHKRYDALLEKIITDREELRKQKEITYKRGDHDVKDLLDILLDALENKNLEITLTRNHIKALVLVCINYAPAIKHK